MENNTVNQNNALPKNIEDILYSEYQHILLYKIHRLYKLLDTDVPVMEEAVRSVYYGELSLTDLNKFLSERIKKLNIDVNALARDIVGMRLLIATDYFLEHGQDVKKYLESNGGISEKYLKNLETFKKALAEEANGTYDHSAYLYDDEAEKPKIILADDENEADGSSINEEDLTDEERVLRLKVFFGNGIGYILGLQGNEARDLLEDINDELILYLVDSPALKDELTKILTTNQANIGQENIIIDDKQAPPTSENWLKDFYHVVGSGVFDSLSIAKYIINSANAKKLAEKDKAKLRRFLTLYHNIKYFPTPFAAIPIEKWEIIPGSRYVVDLESRSIPKSLDQPRLEPKTSRASSTAPVITKEQLRSTTPVNPVSKEAVIKPVAPTPIIKEEPTIAPPPAKEEVVKPVTETAARPADSMVSDSLEITELKNMLLQYPAGSLERAAVEEEIKKLQNS